MSKEYYGILKNLDDLDRTAAMIVDFYGDMEFNLQKVVFFMMLRIYYRNIKHKDGLAEEYEPPLPYASKIAIIQFRSSTRLEFPQQLSCLVRRLKDISSHFR